MKSFVTAFCTFLILASTLSGALFGQSKSRRGNPTTTDARNEFYIVDSDDDSPFKPTFNFVDTTYDPGGRFPWHVVSGFSNPDDASVFLPRTYDTTGFLFFASWDTVLPPPYTYSVQGPIGPPVTDTTPGGSISTNATICLLGADSSANNVPMTDFKVIGTDLVAPLWSDWELLTSGSNLTKIYVRPALDTYLISYYNLGLKGTNGQIRATFQIAFNTVDSTITFHYKSFDGSLNGVSAAAIVQNVATIGLSSNIYSMAATYLHRGYYNTTSTSSQYAQNLHNSLAVKFLHLYREAFLVSNISNPPNDHYELTPGFTSFKPQCVFLNASDSVIEFIVRTTITNLATNTTWYGRTDSVSVLQSQYSTYTTPSTGSIPCGNYKLTFTVSYANGNSDAWTGNNTMTRYFSLLNPQAAPFREEFDGGISNCTWTNVGVQTGDATQIMTVPSAPVNTGSGPKAAIFNRLDANNSPYFITQTGGDTLISPPIDLGTASQVYVSFHYQRALRTDTSKAGVLARYRSGPEMQVMGKQGGLPTPGDTLIVEQLPKWAPKWNPSDTAWRVLTMIPGGFDVKTQTFIAKLNANYLSDHFRLRFRVKAYNSASPVNYIEDADNWAIDAIHVEPFVVGMSELEPLDVDLGNGNYTHIPRDLSAGLTPTVRLLNRGDALQGSGNLHLIIRDALGRWVYDKSRRFDFSSALRDSVFIMPSWDAHGTQGGVMTAIVELENLGLESYYANDTNIFYKTMYLDSCYAIDDGTIDTAGTKTRGPSEWYWHFKPISSDTLRGVTMYYPAATTQTANWSLTITGGGLNTTRGLTYSSATPGWLGSTTTFQKLVLQKDTDYLLHFYLNSGPAPGGDGANGLAYYTLVDSNNSANNQYGVLHPEILSQFYYPGGALPYTTPYKADVDQGGFLLPMFRMIYSGSGTFLPVELVSLTAEREQTGSVAIAWKTANEQNAARFEVYRGAAIVGSATALNAASGADYAVIDKTAPPLDAVYQLFETDLDGSNRSIGTVEVGPAMANSEPLILSYFPNPVSNVLTVETSQPLTVLELVDNLGRIVMETGTHATRTTMDLTNVPNGSYSLVAIFGKQREVRKISVER